MQLIKLFSLVFGASVVFAKQSSKHTGIDVDNAAVLASKIAKEDPTDASNANTVKVYYGVAIPGQGHRRSLEKRRRGRGRGRGRHGVNSSITATATATTVTTTTEDDSTSTAEATATATTTVDDDNGRRQGGRGDLDDD